MDKDKIKKVVVSIVLILIIISGSILLYVYRDKAFTNKIEIVYPDGCKEIYINGKLISDKCIEKLSDDKIWKTELNLTLLK